MIDFIAKNSIWTSVWLTAVSFVDAVLGGIYRASDGAHISGFIPSSIFSAFVFVFAVFTTNSLKTKDSRALLWCFLALVAGSFRGFASPVAPGTLGDYGLAVFVLAGVAFLAVALARFKGTSD